MRKYWTLQEEALSGEHAAEEAVGLLYDRIHDDDDDDDDDDFCSFVLLPKQDWCKQCSI
jgi:hypothetical protein